MIDTTIRQNNAEEALNKEEIYNQQEDFEKIDGASIDVSTNKKDEV